MKRVFFGLMLALVLLQSCQQGGHREDTLFTLLSSAETGVTFENRLKYDRDFNIYTYRNFYNGGGVAVGDINNDGLPDLYFTANMGPNKLYINKGNLQFEDITEKAGVAGTRAWSTGVSMADVNGDGLQDIYVCNSGNARGDNKQNELFINQGDGTFREMAEAYGLADQGYSTHAVFFDYDKDGDLDCYMLNNSYQAIGSFNLRKNERPVRDAAGGDKLYRNDGGRFTDVSEQAGIYGSVIGFGLGVTVGDVNRDGWQDIYISNDFFERDYLYINQQDGTFREVLEEQMRSISAASMGADMADINNDGWPDIFVTDMLPEPEARIKTKTTFENWDRYQYGLSNGYYHQFIRNMLHLNNGDGTFSEIGRMAGVEATDWSWGALMFDMDNDGLKDIFVANGIYQDLTDQDYLNFIADDEIKRSFITEDGVDYQKLIDVIPSEAIPNYAFHNQGDLTFSNRAVDWGLGMASFSNGSAYADLDNDGDLDLIVNNVNMPSFVYRNNTERLHPERRYLKIILEGSERNMHAVGSRVTVRHGGKQWVLEQMPMRGFQSTVDHRPNFGLGNLAVVDTLLVEWYDGRVTIRTQVATNQALRLSVAEAEHKPLVMVQEQPFAGLFRELAAAQRIDYRHQENEFVDFDRDRLLYHMYSTEGPGMAIGDVNSDGLDDVYLGGAKDQAGALYIQVAGGRFKRLDQAVFEEDRVSEDTDAVMVDIDGDGDLDLYVASGGNEFPGTSTALLDRLYLNDGRGRYSRSPSSLPFGKFEPSSCVRVADINGDGYPDLFVGTRLRPFLYGVPASSYILLNDGRGGLRDVTASYAPGLKDVGMVRDAVWADVDGDGREDLLIVGDWMPVRVFRHRGDRLEEDTTALAGAYRGWWNVIKAGDFNGDGRPDFVLGNHGRNSRFRASEEYPVEMYINDFDQNGTVEQLLCRYNGVGTYPVALRHDLVMQIPSLKKNYLKYVDYPGQTMQDIFKPAQLERAVRLTAEYLSSSVMMNTGKGTFSMTALPWEAQLSPVYALAIADMDNDGHQDILLGGNLHRVKPEVGRYDADYGLWLRGDGRGGFRAYRSPATGLRLQGEVRHLGLLEIQGQRHVMVARNNEAVQLFMLDAGGVVRQEK